MPGKRSAPFKCPHCGFITPANDYLPVDVFFRPWHVRGKHAVKAYVESLGLEAREWLLALYCDQTLELLAVDTVARGDIASCRVNFGRILSRGYRLGAASFILVHNHPSGDPTPSEADVRISARLSRTSQELEMPLVAHLIVAGDQITDVLW